MENKEEILLKSTRNNIVELVLNRPKAQNSLSKELLIRLLEELEKVKKDKKIKVLVISANGPSFCAGHDLKEIKQNNSEEFYKNLFNLCSKVMIAITELPKPVIAKVHSTATAAGCQLVATCDLAIASENVKFATPGVNISRKHSMEMLLTGDMINSHQAVSFGLINKVVPEKGLDQAANDLAEKIASKSIKTLAIGKKAFYKQLELGLSNAYSYASEVMTQNMLQEDASEGISAFLEKRIPEWGKL